MYLALPVLRTLFQSVFNMVRSAILVASLTGRLIIFPPAVTRTQLGSFLWGLVDNNFGICHFLVSGYSLYLVVVKEKKGVFPFCSGF